MGIMMFGEVFVLARMQTAKADAVPASQALNYNEIIHNYTMLETAMPSIQEGCCLLYLAGHSSF